ncbi:MAG: type II toxin-antitoxin system VapC family toxin [Vicinamibacterales bacterium]
MIVVDTGAMLALLDADEDFHGDIRELYEENPDAWILPSAILPEVDYLVGAHLGVKAQDALIADLADGRFSVEWGRDEDLTAARRVCTRYRALRLGLVDAIVIATAERLRASAVATLDLRHFAAVSIKGNPRLLPRDR